MTLSAANAALTSAADIQGLGPAEKAQIKRSRSVRFEDDFGKSITGVIAIKSLDRLHSSQPIVIKSKNLLAAVKMIV